MVATNSLVDLASDAAFAVDGGLEIVAWNLAAQRLLGYAASEVIGRHCSDVLQAVLPGDEPLCTPGCEGVRCFRRARPFAAPACRARHKNGGWVSLSIASMVMPKPARRSGAGSTIAVILLRSEAKTQDQPVPEPALQIFTFGCFGLTARGSGLDTEHWKRKQALTLLKYLVAHPGRPVHRETLIECLWPDIDEARARERLKVTVYYLRHQLRAAGISEDVVETVGKTYLLRPEAVWVDALAFERLMTEGAALQREQRWDEALKRYEEAQHLYRGDYMEEDIYADWCAAERERLLELYVEILHGMAECHTALKRYAEAVQVCRTALVLDPCRESFHRTIMLLLVRLGRADWAVAQYRRLERVLATELDVEPMQETRCLYRQILEGGGEAPAEKLTINCAD
jgi:PAS domain S-box-containing protein